MTLLTIYEQLLHAYGPQGWWPLLDFDGINPTKTGSVKGYHPGDYSFPKTDGQKFEICLGAILTQNTAWPNAEKALLNLKAANALRPHAILALPEEKLKEAIRPAGYFNQKARKLQEFAKFYSALKGNAPKRKDLLGIWGIGPETADSILLYAFSQPVFVVDAYTKRIFSGLGFFSEKAGYDEVQKLFEDNLPKDYKLYQEFHALIVEHAKRINNSKKHLNTDFCDFDEKGRTRTHLRKGEGIKGES